MCGIVGYIGERRCCGILVNGLRKLEHRGYDSAGIALFEKNSIKTIKAKGKISEGLVPLLKSKPEFAATAGIGHTRWATHGEPSDINSHPIGNGRVSVVHNGIIENYRELKTFLKSKGYGFESDTDTETVVKMLDYYYDGEPVKAIADAITEIDGAYALGILFRGHTDTIYAVRKESPLIIGKGKNNEMFISSDVTAILEHTREYYLPENNEIAEITAKGVTFYDIHGNTAEKELHTATWDEKSAQKGGFEHFMLKEIYEQPDALKNTISPRIKDGLPDFTHCGITDEKLRKYKNIRVVACGSAMHAGLVGKYVMEDVARIGVTVDIASEFRYSNPLLSKDDLVIIISQSGETADTLAALKLANQIGADTLAAVNVEGSSIAREAKMTVNTLAGPEISVCSTKAYMVQCAFMYLFSFRLALARNTISLGECKEYTADLLKIPDAVRTCAEEKCKMQCQHAASRLVTAESLLYIGRGLDYALSMEGSLKLKEISYIHSESYAAGELKHGTISLITEHTPVIAVATQTSLYKKTAGNIREVKSRGACVITVHSENIDIDAENTDYTITVPQVSEMLSPLVTVVPLQLIAYYTAVLRGCDVDKPRNLAKSVTVE